jgi:hypothetical protein
MIIRARVCGDTEAVIEAALARDPELTKSRLVREAVWAYAREQGIKVPV